MSHMRHTYSESRDSESWSSSYSRNRITSVASWQQPDPVPGIMAEGPCRSVHHYDWNCLNDFQVKAKARSSGTTVAVRSGFKASLQRWESGWRHRQKRREGNPHYIAPQGQRDIAGIGSVTLQARTKDPGLLMVVTVWFRPELIQTEASISEPVQFKLTVHSLNY